MDLRHPVRLRRRAFSGLACTLLCLLAALWHAPGALAAGLYAGSAPVASQSDADRAGALRAAFGQVIVRLANGNASLLARPDVARALTRADRYMQSFGYEADPAQAGHLQLVVQFDRSGVDALLRDLGLDGAPAAASVPAAPPGVDPAAQPTAAQAAGTDPAAPTPGSYRLWITGLRSAEDYARLVGGLGANDQVRALQVEQARGNTLQLRVDARGSLAALTDALAVARLAHASSDHAPAAGVDALLDYDP